METVAFYSYKGGAGRSLLLANAARFLARLGNGVVAVDFDLEAPSLHYQLGTGQDEHYCAASNQPRTGVVSYLLASVVGSASPPQLGEHMMPVPIGANIRGWLRLMPAGQAPQPSYWAALKELGDTLRLNDPSGRGFMALLDLQARVADELKADYLLIDVRAGITELGGPATTVLSDTVVCLFAPNQESLDGTIAVTEALKATPRLANQKPLRIVPVLSRTLPKAHEDERFADGIRKLLDLAQGSKAASSDEVGIMALPHDDAADLVMLDGERTGAKLSSPLYEAYLKLLRSVFPSTPIQPVEPSID